MRDLFFQFTDEEYRTSTEKRCADREHDGTAHFHYIGDLYSVRGGTELLQCVYAHECMGLYFGHCAIFTVAVFGPMAGMAQKDIGF